MLNSILKRSQSITHESPSSTSPQLNPQKPTQKTSQSSQHEKEPLSPEEYTKLQLLLQARQASLREHAKHEHQLKLFVQDLEEKNKALEKNNANILTQYKAEVTAFKKENEALRKMLQKIQNQNQLLKRQLQQALSHNHHKIAQKPQSSVINTTPQPSHGRAKSQSVIKVIESVDHKQSFRESQPNFRLSPFCMSGKQFNMSGKQSPILPSHQSKRNIQSQSRQKLQVTIKSSRFVVQKPKSPYSGRNQKHMVGHGLKHDESVGRDRSLKKLIELKKMSEEPSDSIVSKKLPSQKGSSSIIKKVPYSYIRANDESNGYSKEKSSDLVDEIVQQRIVVRNFSRQLGERKSLHNGNSQQLASGQETISKQVKSTKPNQHELIKLGHYGGSNPNVEKTNFNPERKAQHQKANHQSSHNE